MHEQFWAKAASGEDTRRYKSVAHHNLDVAASAVAFLKENPARLSREAWLSGLLPARHALFCAILAGLHDLGKISTGFQFLAPALWPVDVLGARPKELSRRLRHWEATAVLLNAREVVRALAPVFGREGPDQFLIAAVAGHHGTAPSSCYVNAEPYLAGRDPEIGQACVAAAARYCEDLVALFSDLGDFRATSDLPTFSFSLNGLITLADWVGSDAAHEASGAFPAHAGMNRGRAS